MTTYVLQRKTGTVYDSAPEAMAAAKAAGYGRTALVRFSPVDRGWIVCAVRSEAGDLYLSEPVRK